MATQTHNPISQGPASPTDGHDPVLREAARLAELLADNWQRGVHCRAEELLAEQPALARHARAAVRVIYEEICQRQQRGQEVPLAELRKRFPQWQAELAVVLDCHRILDLAPAGPRFPEVGEMLGEFRLLAELGRGGVGRVYLAEQAFLAGRLAILKVTAGGEQEHLKLARLQHTHIVPLYSVRDFPERRLRALCMPCLGGATLQQIMRHLQDVPIARRTGQDLLAAMSASVADPRLCWLAQAPNRRFLERASYVQAICWIGVCLAEGLHYAHEQGLVHLDVKPSNVLLTADCQPMLLDFHLARGPIGAPGDAPGWLGGTPAYMSPEQRAVWRACRDRQPIAVAVDARSDIYSLGLLLKEMLYGVEAGPRMPRADISRGLYDMLIHCLEENPAARYPSAAALAEDLRRHLTHRPLAGVRNRSLGERWSKWRQRRPHALLVALLVAVCLASVGAWAGMYIVQSSARLRDAQDALAHGRRQVEQRQYAEAVHTLGRALEQLGEGWTDDSLRSALETERLRAARAHDAEALHQQVERMRYLQGDDLLATAVLRELDAQCRNAWAQRHRLLATAGEPLDAALEEQLRRDLQDVAVFLADCRVRLAPVTDAPEARREAVLVLAEAEALFGASPAVRGQRQALDQSGNSDAPPAPHSAWEYCALGRWLFRAGDLAGAAEAFEHAVELRPQDFWPWFGKGLCAHRRRQSADAALAFSVCIALAPDSAACYHNRALALAAKGDAAAALRDYNRALELDPQLAAAALNRGALHLAERRFAQADADFQLARALGADPAAVQFNQALVKKAASRGP